MEREYTYMVDANIAFEQSLIICSRDRLNLLKARLLEIKSVSHKFLQEILIIANFGNSQDFKELQDFVSVAVNDSRFRVLHTNKGLPSARNIGLSSLKPTGVVHFLDDDVSVSNDYFQKIFEFLQSNQSIVGGGPAHRSSHLRVSSRSRMPKVRKILGLESPIGFLTPSMANSWTFEDLSEFVPCNWISGAAMFYKYEIIKDQRFNENLEQGPLGGYGLGEDLDFSFRLSKFGSLAIVPGISIVHSYEPNSSSNLQALFLARGSLCAYFKYSHPDYFKTSKIFSRFTVLNIYDIRNGNLSLLKFFIQFYLFSKGFILQYRSRSYSSYLGS
jgi:GT2 family glycosyltransferase